MSLTLTTPATALPLSLTEAKAITRLDGDEVDDALVAGYIRSATTSVEQYLGVTLITSSWRFHQPHFPVWWDQPIRVPLAPVQAVTEIAYTDVAGVAQVLDSSVYGVSGIGDVGRISLAHGKSWPSTRWSPEGVVVDFTAGYGDSWNDVPEPIRTAIGDVVRAMYDGCSPVLPVEMLHPYRVWPV
jgi:uncharacterized phiE125 gp8 family phage protein